MKRLFNFYKKSKSIFKRLQNLKIIEMKKRMLPLRHKNSLLMKGHLHTAY